MRSTFIPRRQALLLSCLGLAGILLAACQTAPTAPHGTQVLAPLPPLPVQGTAHYAIDAKLSDVRFLVYRAGALASFGHNHVIQAQDIRGDVYLADDFQASGFSLSLPVAAFVVDDPKARSVEGPDFAKQPSDPAIDGTRKNMLSEALLDVVHYPEVHIRSVQLLGPDWGPDARVRIELRGVAQDVSVPISVERNGDTLSVHGAFEIKQSDFGIKPFSVLGGGLQVADTLRIRFHLVAQKAP